MQNDCAVVLPADYVGRALLFEDGCLRQEYFYFRGHRYDLRKFGRIRFFNGWTGPETEVLVSVLSATCILKVNVAA